MEKRDEKLMRDVHASFNVNVGTTAPFAIGKFAVEKVGFANIPTVQVVMACKDTVSVVMVARQYVYRELEAAGVPNEAIEFTPTVQVQKQRHKFTDLNESSPDKGKTKMGLLVRFAFEIKEAFVKTYFEWDWAGHGTIKRQMA